MQAGPVGDMIKTLLGSKTLCVLKFLSSLSFMLHGSNKSCDLRLMGQVEMRNFIDVTIE